MEHTYEGKRKKKEAFINCKLYEKNEITFCYSLASIKEYLFFLNLVSGLGELKLLIYTS